jgi:hypothetical protein
VSACGHYIASACGHTAVFHKHQTIVPTVYGYLLRKSKAPAVALLCTHSLFYHVTWRLLHWIELFKRGFISYLNAVGYHLSMHGR